MLCLLHHDVTERLSLKPAFIDLIKEHGSLGLQRDKYHCINLTNLCSRHDMIVENNCKESIQRVCVCCLLLPDTPTHSSRCSTKRDVEETKVIGWLILLYYNYW